MPQLIQTGKKEVYSDPGAGLAEQAKGSAFSSAMSSIADFGMSVGSKMMQTEHLEMAARAGQMAATKVPALAVKYQNDISGFNKAVSEIKYDTPSEYEDNAKFSRFLKDATTKYQSKYDVGISANTESNRINRAKTAAKTLTDTLLDSAVDDTKFGHEESAKKSIELYAGAINKGVKEGVLTPEEGQSLMAVGAKKTTTAMHERLFDEAVSKGGEKGGLEYIDSIENGGDLGGKFGANYREELTQTLQDKLKNKIDMETKVETHSDRVSAKMQDDNYSNAYGMRLTGNLDDNHIITMVGRRLISPAQGQTLTALNSSTAKQIKVTAPDVDNHLASMIVNQAPQDSVRNYVNMHIGKDITADDAVRYVGLSKTNSEKAIFSTQSYKVAIDQIVKNLTTTSAFQALDTSEQQRIASAKLILFRRVSNGEDPQVVAKEIIPRFLQEAPEVSSYPRPKYGDEKDMDNADELLAQARLRGEISKSTFDFEFENNQNIRKAQANEQKLTAANKNNGERK